MIQRYIFKMGIDVHSLNFLRFARRHGDLKKTATLGRQEMFFWPIYDRCRELLSLPHDYPMSGFCENLLMDCFGSELVHSFDANSYEGCTFVEDFNLPLSNDHIKYDTVIDAGTLEHVFDVIQGLKNLTKLCAVGGQILHIAPCNNFNGHGFWQFSSEVFFNLYSKKNGFKDTQIFYADAGFKNIDQWWEVFPVQNQRNNFNPDFPLFVMCRTVKEREEIDFKNIQQQDYEYAWGTKTEVVENLPAMREIIISDLI